MGERDRDVAALERQSVTRRPAAPPGTASALRQARSPIRVGFSRKLIWA